MKYKMLFLLTIVAISAHAQITDSIAIKQVDSLIQVSRDLTAKRDFDKALEVNAEAEKIALGTFGRESAEYGSCVFNRGRVNQIRGNHPESEKWYLEAKTIREAHLGVEHPDYAWSLNNLGVLYMTMGQYEKAETFYLEAKAIRKKVLGKEHPDYAANLNNLGIMYHNMGQYKKAEPFYLEALVIKEKVVGKEHSDYAQCLSNLGVLNMDMGQYEKAEAFYLEALVVEEKVLGKEEPQYSISLLINLGILYRIMGQYEKAELFYLKALIIKEKVVGKEHPEYAQILNNLGVLNMDMGQYEKAEAFYLEALDINEKTLGKEHPHYPKSLVGLGITYRKMGQYKKAELFYLEAIAIQKNVLGKEHPNYAQSLNNLAVLYWYMGNYEKTESLYLEAKSIGEKAQGKEHPDYANSLSNLASLYENMGQYQKAEPLFLELSAANKHLIERALHHLSEKELINYLKKFSQNQHQILSFTQLASSKKLIPICYNNSLFYKGFLLQSIDRIKQLALSDEVTTEKYYQLKSYQRRLAPQYAQPVADRDSSLVSQLESQSDDIEKDLASTVAGWGEATRQVKWQDVQTVLPETAIALEFVHFQVNFPQSTDSIMVAALLLKPGVEQPLFIPLFEEKELDHLLSADKERKADYVNELYTWADRGMVKLGQEKKSLYDLIWAKIEAAGLEDIKTIYYSPSGVLHRLNLGAIAIDDETILSDRYNLVAMNSTRQLVIPSVVTTQSNDAFLVGGINFEVDSIQSTFEEPPLFASRSEADKWTQSDTRGGSWSYLKWTEKEVDRIASSLTTGGFVANKLTGLEPTEEAIKSIGTETPSPRILHIATHGFFFPDPEEATSYRGGLGEAEPVFKSSDNPMIRSGLILAGGNYAWQHGQAVNPDQEDGILTAYEISQMNLANTELVVLSACETGLGDIQGNEGVYGLQRAFKIAGARYLIMSLWQVPDRETMEFMTTFYRNWLEEEMTIPDAFRKTQLEMRDRFFNPYSWAGFVLVE